MSRFCIYRLSNKQPLHQWCKENNVSYNKVFHYLNLGLMVDDACRAAKQAKKSPIMYKGKSLRSSFSISAYNSILKHMKSKNCSIEEAIEIYNFNKSQGYIPRNVKAVVNLETGKFYNTVKECASDLGISPNSLINKIRKGCHIKYIYRG